MTKQPG